jgi:hypothetical protein
MSDFLREKNQYAGHTHVGPAPNNFLQDLLKLCRTGIISLYDNNSLYKNFSTWKLYYIIFIPLGNSIA